MYLYVYKMAVQYNFIMTQFILRVLTFVFIISLTTEDIITSRNTQYVFKVKQESKIMLFRSLFSRNFILRYQITPSTYIFEYVGTRQHNIISDAKKLFPNKIIAVEAVRVYNDTLKPEGTRTERYSIDFKGHRNSSTNLKSDANYGMDIPKAWSRGYSGEGVTIAVTDVGVNTDLLDLKNNINNDLSYNYVDGTTNVTPEFYHDIQDKASALTDHGNRVASIIAAEKGNRICSAGMSYKANVVALKIYRVELFNDQIPVLEPNHWTRSDIISRALVHALDDIDIFANAWAPTKPFDKLDLATREAIEEGAKNGRHGLGTIYVVPSGPPGNGLANNINTLTVNSIGRQGTISPYTYIDANVLTSGLGDGQNLTATSMVTTTLKNKCSTGFKGVSAATAQVSAIIGLAIEANPNISLRDVQHLLVQASEHKDLQESVSFKPNGAGRHFHIMFGFGLLNADKIVMLAKRQIPTPELFSKRLDSFRKRSSTSNTQIHDVCYTCDSNHNCLAGIEHVVLEMEIGSVFGEIYIALKSPQGTTSVLLGLKPNQYEGPSVGKLKLVSVHFWDEVAFGTWRLNVTNNRSSQADIGRISLTLYGTGNTEVAPVGQLPEVVCEKDTNSGNTSDLARPTSNITTSVTLKETSILDSVFKLFIIVVAFSIIGDIMLTVYLYKSRKSHSNR